MEKGHWTIPKEVVKIKISEGAKLIYGILWTRKNADYVSWPSRKYLSSQTGYSERTVDRHISELKRVDLVGVKRRGLGRSNLYFVKSDSPIMATLESTELATPLKSKNTYIRILAPSVSETPMRTYNENNFQDEGLGTVDLEGIPVQPISGGEKKPNNLRLMRDLIDWAVKRRGGGPFVNMGKQYKAIRLMREAKISPARIKERWEELENDEFYKKAGFDFMTIASSFDKK